MLTVDFDRLGSRAGDRLLDMGCGGGRHAFEAMRRGATVVALDYSTSRAQERARRRRRDARRRRARPTGVAAVRCNGDALALPFPDASVRPRRSRPRCSSTSGTTRARSPSSSGCCGPAAASRSPCRRAGPSASAGRSTTGTTTRPGGHVRIYRQHELEQKLERPGCCLRGSHHAHALHSPYWWLQVRGRRRQRRRTARCAGTTTSSRGRSRAAGLARRGSSARSTRCSARASSSTREKVGRCTDGRCTHFRPSRDPHRRRGRARPSTRSPRCSSPTATSRGPRAATPTRGTSSRPRWRSTSAAATTRPRARTSGCARCSTPTAAGTRTTSATTVKDHDARHQRHRATSRTASGTTTSRTGDTAFLEEFWPSRRAGDRLRARRTSRRRPARSRGGATTPPTARCSPARRASTRACAARSRSPSGSATSGPTGSSSLGCLAIAIAHRPDAFLDKDRWAMDWYYPILGGVLRGDAAPTRASPRTGTRSSSTGAACAASRTSRGSPPPRRASSCMALDAIGARRPARASCSRGCSSCATTTAATGPA